MSQTALYRHYDADGQLLYVGAARSIRSRTEQHMRESEWAARSVRAEVSFFPTRGEAFEAEMAAIQAERPLHNKVRTRRSINTPPPRPKRVPVGDMADARSSNFPALWAEYLKGRFGTAYAVKKAFGIDSHTARDWIGGKRDPSGSYVAAAIKRDPTSIEILGRIE